jgi:RHS repeat-associated protein
LLNGASSSPISLTSETYNYDGDLRPSSLTATWLPGSNNSGQILAQSRTYDNVGNVTSTNTTFASISGQSGSGGSEVQNFCYNEQNELVWAGNGGTQPDAGNGTCGTGTLNSGLTNGGYTASYSYTNLGQIWQGPLDGTGSTLYQYLYCNSSEPHTVSGLYPSGTTCSSQSGAVYHASHDSWGNVTTRTYNGVGATLSYDALNHLVEYSASNGQELYVYDASGERVLTRSTVGSATTLTAYAYGLQEITYSGAGNQASQLDYYSIAGHLLGETNGTTTTYDLTDAQGTILLSLTGSAIQGEQAYGPYGNQRYSSGTISTDKGYTGQFDDAVTGLDYYNARWYDPVSGQFLSPDSVQGNAQGMDPYAYVGNDPETRVDPTGNRFIQPTGPGGTCPSGEEPVSGGCAQDPGKSEGNGSGGCPKAGDSKCSGNETKCNIGMSVDNVGDCIYNSGNCAGLTTDECKQQQQHIRHAQEAAQAEALKLAALAAFMLLVLANMPILLYKAELLADFFQTAALTATGLANPIAAAVFWGLFGMAKLAEAFIAGSIPTLILGGLADGRLAALFQEQASDDDPAVWTPSAVSRFSSQVDGFANVVSTTSSVLSILTGNGWVDKLIGFWEPTTLFYGFSGIDSALDQMQEDI